jgi:hypothetical protein
MNDAEDGHDFPFHNENNSVGESLGKHPADGITAMPNWIKERIGLQGIDGFADFVDKSSAEADLAFFIPERCLFNIRLNRGRSRSSYVIG